MKLIVSILGLVISFNLFASEAIGFYSKGKIENSVSIDDYSESHVRKLYRNRGQLYGTTETMLALTSLADHMKANFPTVEVTQIGDISSRNGRKIRRHKSHQNGLDSDVVYYRVNEQAQPESETEWGEDFVINGKLTKNFHIKRNWEAMKFLVNNHDVGRIFVDGQIKKALCAYAKKTGEFEQEKETLRRLRIENSVHMHHFHLRLKCPAGNSRCKAQGEPQAGSGC
ncbi:MAG: penicillin-insensitive murein endopeptidase [Bacteriovoracaceae bacterium]|jgi:penicillin-insensitive murein endopeptidase